MYRGYDYTMAKEFGNIEQPYLHNRLTGSTTKSPISLHVPKKVNETISNFL